MVLEKIPYDLTVCKAPSIGSIRLTGSFFFIGRTDEEISLVCPTADVPADTTAREDGWGAFRIRGILDLSLVGILSKLTGILAENGIGIFAVSTWNTDYVLVRKKDLDRALDLLAAAGYTVC